MAYVVALIGVAIVMVAFALWGRAKRRRLGDKPARESSGFVLLEGNAWDDCRVDDIREPWSRLTTEPVRGFCGVPAGRHRVVTKCERGDATVDFVLYPGEVLSWRLDVDNQRWQPTEIDADTRALLDTAPLSTSELGVVVRPKLPGWLVHLRTTVSIVSTRTGAPTAKADSDGVARVQKRLAALVARAEGDADLEADELLVHARGLGEALVGRALTRKELRAVVSPARVAAQRLLDNGNAAHAMQMVGLGLAILPGDPELMVVCGQALALRGETEAALAALNAALERDRCLAAEDVARAMRARMELRARLGRTVRV